MAEEKMQNPYEKDGIAHSEIEIGRGATCMFIALFVLILLLPPLYRNVYEATSGEADAWVPVAEVLQVGSGQKLTEHLKEFESDLEGKAAFTDPPRQALQGAMTGLLREGNRKTYVGKDGWLYLQAALDAMTGYGPITPEPDSVAKDPNRKPWSGPLGAIETFAAQLEELGVELVLVPIPVKPMIYPENISGRSQDEPLEHRDAAEFYQQVEALPNARVIDLSSAFMDLKTAAPIFLKQDTHWTPFAMEQAAEAVALELGGKRVYLENPSIEVENIGDLAEQLELPDGGLQWFLREKVVIRPVPDFVSDPTAEIVLLGDSFTNIYSAKSLNWGEKAGFAEHLAMNLGQPLDVIAKNGQASTGVRIDLAKRGREHLKKKKTVIWAIAARDLFLSETAARENNVRWDDVEIPDIPDTVEKLTGDSGKADLLNVTGTLVKQSAIKDPSTVTYKNAIFVNEYQVEGSEEIMLVSEWAFRDKKLTAASGREIGEKVLLELVPFDSQKELMREQMFDDYTEDFERTRYWAMKAESAEMITEELSKGDPARASMIASIVCALAVLLVGGLATRLAKG